VLRIGVQEASLPFAYVGQDGNFHGYSVDICRRVADRLEEILDHPPGFRVEFVGVTSRTRIPLLLAGEIDLECGSTSKTAARRALGIAFSPTIFVSDIAVLMTPTLASDARSASSWTERLHDEPRATLVTTAGSTSVPHLREIARLAGGKLGLLYGASHEDSFQKLERGEAAAFVMDRSLLTSRLASSDILASRGFVVSPWSLAQDERECYGLMRRDGGGAFDGALGRAVDETVIDLMRNGGLRELHRRWFEEPIADPRMRPRGVDRVRAFGETISYTLRRQIANPAIDVCQPDTDGAPPFRHGRR
jgi:glutamate/aspartate transport system substrate-binding protein